MADYTFTQTGPEIQDILNESARVDEQNTFAEAQTFDKPIENIDPTIMHNTASFIWNSASNTLTGAPSGWTAIKDSDFDFHLVHGLGKLVYPTAIAADDTSIGAFVTFADAFKGGGVLNACRFIVRGGDSVPVTVPVSVRINLSF